MVIPLIGRLIRQMEAAMSLLLPREFVIAASVAAFILALGAFSVPAYAQDQSAPAAHQAMPGGTDSSAATRVKTALNSNPTFDAKHVDVSIEHGDVVLKGFVQSNSDLLQATTIATKAADGRKVVNNLTIKQNYPNAP
jgi:osmotically-inducible protein OsmY